MMLSLLLFGATMLLSLWASSRVKSVYNRYLEVPATSGLTGAQAAARIMQDAGIYDVEILEQEGKLIDHYDPTNKRLVLSSDNYHGRSLSALGVAAHEVGHAIQHQQAYAPLHMRMAAVGITNIANQVVLFLPILGLFTGFIKGNTMMLIMAIGWGIIMLFNLITLPVEFDATARAKRALANMGMISPGEEANGVNRVLSAAAWTYVAAFITTFSYFLYHLLPLLLGGRRDEE